MASKKSDTPEYRKAYYAAHKEESKQRKKVFREKNPNYDKEYMRAYPRERLLYFAKNRCKLSGLCFDITVEDVIIPRYCPYLGCELTLDGGRKQTSASLDRIDNTKGYIKGNIQVISDLANRMKSNTTLEQLVTFAQNVIKLHHPIPCWVLK